MPNDAVLKSDKFFGTCDFEKSSPRHEDLSPSTPKVHVVRDFENALKLNLAIEECVRKLNRYNRHEGDGKRMAMSIDIHFDKGRVTVTQAKI